MPIIVDKLPQDIKPPKMVSIYELIEVLPETIPYQVNVWIGDKIARYGMTAESLLFLAEMDGETTTEMKQYFENLVVPLGLPATASSNWKSPNTTMRLYNKGRLIIDKQTFSYREVPSRVETSPILTIEELLTKLPKKVKWVFDIWLVGGIVKNGFSNNDVDLMVFDHDELFKEIRDYFTKLLGCKVDVGSKFMPEREPIYQYLLYKNGELCLF